MIANSRSEVEKTIKDYIVLQEMFRLYAKKRNDLRILIGRGFTSCISFWIFGSWIDCLSIVLG